MELTWKWYTFTELTAHELYAVLRLRQEIFIVEQQCAYLDCDDLDKNSWHLVGWYQSGEKREVVAYLRIIYPGQTTLFPQIGRLLTHSKVRKRGFGSLLIKKALHHIHSIYPGSSVLISAQVYLTSFYETAGFRSISDVYEEDNIPHIKMIFDPSQPLKKPPPLIDGKHART